MGHEADVLENIVKCLSGKPAFVVDPLNPYYTFQSHAKQEAYLTPDEFLHLAFPLFPDRYKPKKLTNLREAYEECVPLPPLLLSVNTDTGKIISHDGRHRAKVAKDIGIEKLPVLIYHYEVTQDQVDFTARRGITDPKQMIPQYEWNFNSEEPKEDFYLEDDCMHNHPDFDDLPQPDSPYPQEED